MATKEPFIHRVNWIYQLPSDFAWKQSIISLSEGFVFYDKNNNARLKIAANGTITVFKSYAWDGCAPKLAIGNTIIGTPEGSLHPKIRLPKTYYASLVHDALYQFLDEAQEVINNRISDQIPYTKADADKCFRLLMQEYNFWGAWLYYIAVIIFGNIFHNATKKRRSNVGSIKSIPTLQKYSKLPKRSLLKLSVNITQKHSPALSKYPKVRVPPIPLKEKEIPPEFLNHIRKRLRPTYRDIPLLLQILLRMSQVIGFLAALIIMYNGWVVFFSSNEFKGEKAKSQYEAYAKMNQIFLSKTMTQYNLQFANFSANRLFLIEGAEKRISQYVDTSIQYKRLKQKWIDIKLDELKNGYPSLELLTEPIDNQGVDFSVMLPFIAQKTIGYLHKLEGNNQRIEDDDLYRSMQNDSFFINEFRFLGDSISKYWRRIAPSRAEFQEIVLPQIYECYSITCEIIFPLQSVSLDATNADNLRLDLASSLNAISVKKYSANYTDALWKWVLTLILSGIIYSLLRFQAKQLLEQKDDNSGVQLYSLRNSSDYMRRLYIQAQKMDESEKIETTLHLHLKEMYDQVESMKARSNIMLSFGILIAIVGVIVAYVLFFLSHNSQSYSYNGTWQDRLLSNLPDLLRGLSLLIFIQSVAWFLLRLSRNTMDDHRIFFRAFMKRMNQLTALRLYKESKIDTGKNLKDFADKLLEENFEEQLLKAGETTLEIERKKLDDTYMTENNAVRKIIDGIIQRIPIEIKDKSS